MSRLYDGLICKSEETPLTRVMVGLHPQFEPHIAQERRNSKAENKYHEHLPFTIQPSRTVCRFHRALPHWPL